MFFVRRIGKSKGNDKEKAEKAYCVRDAEFRREEENNVPRSVAASRR